MDVAQMGQMGRELVVFLREFDGCFGRSEPREHLRTYVAGQVSDLPRKSIEPIALAAGVRPRTLQAFLSNARWNEDHMVDQLERIVARDHAHPKAIGVIDETGNPKKGQHTAGVQRQWCGNAGKVDNCVVGVHLSYVVGDFQCLLDGDLFLPKDWADDPQRRAEAKIPDDVVFRTKPQIALGQVHLALGNGIRVAAWTFDEGYGRGRDFLDGLDGLGQNYVGEVPLDFVGWTQQPRVLRSPGPQERRKQGRKRHYPRLARKALPACRVDNLCRYSPVFQNQKWQRFRIKDGEKGPVVWEVKHGRFYRKHGPDGLPKAAHTLIVARNVLQPDEVKYFVSNLLVGSEGVTLKWLLWIAFSRWPVERCFEVAKRELGMDHFEVRSWCGIHRHLYISQLSQLFCARVHQRLREKNDPHVVPDGRTGPPSRLRVDRCSALGPGGPADDLPKDRPTDRLLPAAQPTGPTVAHKDHASKPPIAWDRHSATAIVQTG
jgi:SRSO17 transposase